MKFSILLQNYSVSHYVVGTYLKIGDWPTLHPFSRKERNQIQQMIDQLVLQLFYVRF